MNPGIGSGDCETRRFALLTKRGAPGLPPPVAVAGLATVIFVLDVALPWDVAIEVLYVVVILLASSILRRKETLLVGFGCASLAGFAWLLEDDPVFSVTKAGQHLVAIVVMGITTFFVAKDEKGRGMEQVRALIHSGFPSHTPAIDRTPEMSAGSAASPSGWVVNRSGTNTDIDGPEQSEAPRERTDDDVRTAIDSIPTHVWTLHPDGTSDFFNRRRLEYTGPGVDFLAIIHPDDRPEHDALWATALAAGSAIELELRLRRFDGNYRWFLFRAEPQCDANGRIVKWFGTNTDIDDLRRAEQLLRRSEAYLADAQSLSKTGSFGWRKDRSRTFWSDEIYRLFYYDRLTEPSIEGIMARIHPDDVVELRHLIDRLEKEASDISAEPRMVGADGAIKHLRLLARPLTEVLGESEFIGAVIDITASRQAEEALQRTQGELAHVTRVATLGELTASIAHEVNQPLTGIVTNGEACLRWLRRDVPDLQEAESAVERMVGDGQRAGEVVRRLRALTRKDEPRRLPVDLNEVVEEALPLVRHEFSRYGITLQLALSPGLPTVLGDRVQLQQVVINLIVNGIQAMADINDWPAVLTISSRAEETEEGEVVVAVRDSGIGITPATREHLFDAFFTTRVDGMGMGLSICRSIVEAHGGRIWAAPNSAVGAVFMVALPAQRKVLG